MCMSIKSKKAHCSVFLPRASSGISTTFPSTWDSPYVSLPNKETWKSFQSSINGLSICLLEPLLRKGLWGSWYRIGRVNWAISLDYTSEKGFFPLSCSFPLAAKEDTSYYVLSVKILLIFKFSNDIRCTFSTEMKGFYGSNVCLGL